MTDALARRGPDGDGLQQWDGAALGHRRLAIFDLSDAGAQPMLSPDGRIGITFNGAIYNFRVLREDLKVLGYTFVSDTDTEVLIHGYDAWGIERLVSRLRGMFAFALWDDRSHELFLVRDRLGVKPLLYIERDGIIAFASTAASLKQTGLCGELDDQSLAEFLEYGFVTDARSIYRGVRKVAAGHLMRWKAGQISTKQYWAPREPDRHMRISFSDAVEQAEHLFLEAVKLRLDADVPVGALLSGGIDSSLVCWAIAKLGGDITAFTVGTPGDAWDETADARATAKELGLKHHVLALGPSDTDGVDDLVAAFAEPFACASALGMIAVSKAVKGAATVLLTGDGGDDVFLGYPRHRHYALAQRFAEFLPEVSTPIWRGMRTIVPKRGVLRRAAHFADYATGGLGAVVSAHDGFPEYTMMGMLGDRFSAPAIAEYQLPWSIERGRSVLRDFIAYERRTRFTGEYLPKVDGATMFHALEARSPFLDHELWAFASSLPYGLRLHNHTPKAILRELAHRAVGPRVAHGTKRGFGVPVQRWISGKWRKNVQESFRNSQLDREGWIKAKGVLEALDRVRPNEMAPVQIWHAYVLEMWLKRDASQPRNVHGVWGAQADVA